MQNNNDISTVKIVTQTLLWSESLWFIHVAYDAVVAVVLFLAADASK